MIQFRLFLRISLGAIQMGRVINSSERHFFCENGPCSNCDATAHLGQGEKSPLWQGRLLLSATAISLACWLIQSSERERKQRIWSLPAQQKSCLRQRRSAYVEMASRDISLPTSIPVVLKPQSVSGDHQWRNRKQLDSPFFMALPKIVRVTVTQKLKHIKQLVLLHALC